MDGLGGDVPRSDTGPVGDRMDVQAPSTRRVKPYEWLVLALGLALFLGLTCYQLRLPGLHYDEAIEVVPTMQLLLGQPVDAFRGAGIRVGGLFLPLMVMDYIGAMNTYLALPFFALLGIDVEATRLMPILFATITLFLTYAVARELYGRLAAAIAYLALAASISFVFWSRQGIFVTNLTSTIMMASLLCALRWWRGGRRRYLFLTAFLWGLGLYTKFIFLWAIGGMIGAGVILNVDRILAWLRRRDGSRQELWRPRAGSVGGSLIALLIPLSPLILFNLQTGGTLSTLSRNMARSYYGVNNLAFIPNLLTRIEQLETVLRGDHFWYLGEVYGNACWPPALLASLVLVLAVAIIRRHVIGDAGRAALFPFVMIGLIVVQSCFTISALWFTHFAILTPLPPLALAGALTFVGRHAGLRKGIWLPLVLVVVALIGYDLLADIRYHEIMGLSGGYAAHSDANYRLAEAMEEEAAGPAVALDWGIQAPVQLLTRGRVAPRELFGYDSLEAPDADFAERLAPYLADPRTVYILHANDQEVYRGRASAFSQLVEKSGKQSRIVEVVYERSGRPAYVLLKVD